jgi:hypothetical protein
MLTEYLWHALIGVLLALVFVGALLLNVRYERARRRAEQNMTPEERKERDILSKAAGKGWGLPL